jgi:hypothetical protein
MFWTVLGQQRLWLWLGIVGNAIVIVALVAVPAVVIAATRRWLPVSGTPLARAGPLGASWPGDQH